RMENYPNVGDALRIRSRMSDAIAPDGIESAPVRGGEFGWFRSLPAADDGVFHDLVGNVAEFVTAEKEVDVIGGSAISAKDEGADGLALPLGRNGVARKFGDVGFRVAYSVPKLTAEPAAKAPNRDENIREAINKLSYLRPDAPKARAQ